MPHITALLHLHLPLIAVIVSLFTMVGGVAEGEPVCGVNRRRPLD